MHVLLEHWVQKRYNLISFTDPTLSHEENGLGHKVEGLGRGPNKQSKDEQTWLNYMKSKNQVTLFVNCSYNSFYEFRSSVNK